MKNFVNVCAVCTILCSYLTNVFFITKFELASNFWDKKCLGRLKQEKGKNTIPT